MLFICPFCAAGDKLNPLILKKEKNSLSCLHLAIYEAGVHGLFDFVSYPQTQRGLPLLYSSSAKGASRRGGGWGDIFYTGSPLQDGQISSCDPIRYGNVGHVLTL